MFKGQQIQVLSKLKAFSTYKLQCTIHYFNAIGWHLSLFFLYIAIRLNLIELVKLLQSVYKTQFR